MESRAVFLMTQKDKMKRIAIQGEQGSFHDIAAHEYFGQEQIELICCATFEQVFENIRRDPAVVGMLAIENTIACPRTAGTPSPRCIPIPWPSRSAALSSPAIPR